jgi:hypothetical protein
MASVSQTSDYPSWLAREERKAERVAVAWDATLVPATSGDEMPCHMLDITHLGCRLRMERAPSVGTHVNIVIPAFAGVAGWIAWKADGEAGIDFAHPLPADVLSEVIRRNGGNLH